jgi:Flp pilus assembly protein TadB
MIYCGTEVDISANKDCLKKGIGVRLLDETIEANESDAHPKTPYDFFEKGLSIGKRLKEGFEGQDLDLKTVSIRHIVITLVVTLIVFGAVYMIHSWIWALVVSVVVGTLFWLYCDCS